MSSFREALGLDIGAARIGVARINYIAQISEPLVVLQNDDKFVTKLQKIIVENHTDLIVVGLPRNMSGETTKQTEYVRGFVTSFASCIDTTIVYQDETLSSVAADARLSKKLPSSMQDAVAAAVILEDYIQTIRVQD
jgi:putative holliday junction resolvase